MKFNVNTLALAALAGSLATTMASNPNAKEYPLNAVVTNSTAAIVWVADSIPALSATNASSKSVGPVLTDNAGTIEGVQHITVYHSASKTNDYAVFAADVKGTIGNQTTNPFVKLTIKGPGYYIGIDNKYTNTSAISLTFASSGPAITTNIIAAPYTNALGTFTNSLSFSNTAVVAPVWSLGQTIVSTNIVSVGTNNYPATTNYTTNVNFVINDTNVYWASNGVVFTNFQSLQPTNTWKIFKLSGFITGSVKYNKATTVAFNGTKKISASITGGDITYTLVGSNYVSTTAGGLTLSPTTSFNSLVVQPAGGKNPKFTLVPETGTNYTGSGAIKSATASFTATAKSFGYNRGSSFILKPGTVGAFNEYSTASVYTNVTFTNSIGTPFTNLALPSGKYNIVSYATNTSGSWVSNTVISVTIPFITNTVDEAIAGFTVATGSKTKGQKVAGSGANVSSTASLLTNAPTLLTNAPTLQQ